MSHSTKMQTILASGAAVAGAAVFLVGCNKDTDCAQFKSDKDCSKQGECFWLKKIKNINEKIFTCEVDFAFLCRRVNGRGIKYY